MVKLGMSKYCIVSLEEAISTNGYALENFTSFDDKTVIFTEYQTMGRGRYNRKWVSDDSGNLYVSIILKPKITEKYPFANLTQYLSVVICNCLQTHFNINANIKWPNDILVQGHKISGILAESYVEHGKITGIVLGLGLNVNLKKETLDSIDQKATSLSVLNNQIFDVKKVLNVICEEFFLNYEDFIANGFSFIKRDYIKKCEFLGKNITIKEANDIKEYKAMTIDDDGLLIALNNKSEECRIITGDIYVTRNSV